MADYNIRRAFERIEEELIASMIRNMSNHRAQEDEEGFQWEQWQALQLKELEAYKRRNQKLFGKKFREINAQLELAILKARENGNMEQELELLEMVKSGKIKKPRATKKSAKTNAEFFKINDRKMDALIKATVSDMKRAETAILRMANDKYRKIIFDAQVYANSGAGTYEKAVDMATRDFLAAGLNCVEYKNGARHTLKDYAEMALKTAVKRAYLTGEGEKRKEWGIPTVIMNKRGNPCPLCLPFVGKVMIDDVWSGGSSKDGKYPLMSDAISKGLYHPRCRDSHSTYFEGISTPPDDKFTKEEIKEIEEVNKAEAKKQNAQRQAEKFERISENSLDAENKKKNKAKQLEWENIVNRQEGFIPAATIEEAEEYAKRFVVEKTWSGDGNISYKGLSIESANKINETLKNLYDNNDIPPLRNISPMNFREKIWKGNETVPMAYRSLGNGDLFFNPKIMKDAKALEKYMDEGRKAYKYCMENIDSFTGADRKLLETYLKAGKSLVADEADNAMKAIIEHEMGHHIQHNIIYKSSDMVEIVKNGYEKYGVKISGYATKTYGEYIAESYAAYCNGKADIIDPELEKVFDGIKKGKAGKVIEKAKKSSIMKAQNEYARIFPEEKLVDYALNPQRSPDKAKAFELALGYTAENYQDLKEKILELAVESNFVEKSDKGYGMTYECIVEITGPNGKTANVVTAWIQDGDNKRLTSVYVKRRKMEK